MAWVGHLSSIPRLHTVIETLKPYPPSAVPQTATSTMREGYFGPPDRSQFRDSAVIKAIYDEGHVTDSEPKGSKVSAQTMVQ